MVPSQTRSCSKRPRSAVSERYASLLLSRREGRRQGCVPCSQRLGRRAPDAPSEELGPPSPRWPWPDRAAENLAERLLDEPATTAVEELSDPLTARESEVLDLLGHGLSNKMIARELHISEHTVKFHISSLYSKLAVSNRAEAVSQGARRGLISL